MASAEGGSVPSGVGWPGKRVPGHAAARNGFWRISKATERSFLYLYDKIWGTICISVPLSKFCGDLSPCPASPSVIYAHAYILL